MYQDMVLRDGAVAYWPMNETSGTTLVDKVAGQNMTLAGGYTLGVAGPFSSKSVTWNGSTGQGSASDSAALSITGALSLETWVKTTASSGILVIKAITPFGNTTDINYELDFYTDGNLYFTIGNRSSAGQPVTASRSLINDGLWHHVVGTWSGSTATNGLKLYVDAVLAGQATSSISSITDTSDPVLVGKPNGVNNYPLTGTQAHVAIYNSELTAGQVYHHYRAGLREGVTY